MAYGRGDLTGSSGQSTSATYNYAGDRDARDYLKGDLRTQYDMDMKLLSDPNIREVKGSKQQAKALNASLAQRQAALGRINRLREVAASEAVKDFHKFARASGKASDAVAAHGFLSPETINVDLNNALTERIQDRHMNQFARRFGTKGLNIADFENINLGNLGSYKVGQEDLRSDLARRFQLIKDASLINTAQGMTKKRLEGKMTKRERKFYGPKTVLGATGNMNIGSRTRRGWQLRYLQANPELAYVI